MVTLNTYYAGWPDAPSEAIIGPDGNLWAVTGTAHVFMFDTTAFTTTTYTVSGATALIGLATDGTYLYASEQSASSSPYTLVYKVTTAGISSVFYNASGSDNGGALHFDGTYLWECSYLNLVQLDLSGGVINSYTGPHTYPLEHLLNDGTYWLVGSNSSAGMFKTPVASPGTWTLLTYGTSFTHPGVEVGGLVWAGATDTSMYSVDPTSGSVGAYAPSVDPGAQSEQICFDGTSLWVAFNNGGIWQTTPADPTMGTNYTAGVNASTILFDSATRMMWATGATEEYAGVAYSAYVPTATAQQIMIM